MRDVACPMLTDQDALGKFLAERSAGRQPL
jgi:hypothetical protein